MKEAITLPVFKQRVEEKIDGRNSNLVNLFKDGEYDKMPGEFTLHSRIVTHEGEVILGKDSENYWRKVGDELKGTNLEFKNPHLEAMKLNVSPANKPEEFDFVAFEITEFHFTAKGQEYNGYIDPPYRHRVKCIID